MPRPDAIGDSPTRAAGAVLLALGLACFCYWPALRGGMLWDDDAHVTKPGLQSVAGLGRIWSDVEATQQYYPLLHSAFWAEHRIWGGATLGYHLTNLLLHTASAGLLVLLLRRLRVPGSSLAGILFLVHPICVESVAWISEQKNTLSLVFYLLAATAYLGFDAGRDQPAGRSGYWLASLLFVCALLTKSVTATLPAALLVVLWWQRGRLAWRDWAPLLPWFAVALLSGLFTAYIERRVIGADGAEFSLTLLQRCLLAGRVIWFYLGKLAWPAHLAFIYPRWDAGAPGLGWSGYFLAAVAVSAALWALRRRSRGPLAGWLLFVGSLFPVMGFFNVYPFLFSYVADHFQYQAALGMIALTAAGIAWLLNRARPSVRAIGWALVAVWVATLSVVSRAQSRTYTDLGTFYETEITRNPQCWLAYNNLGLLFADRGDTPRAIALYQEALRLRPDYPEAHDNLGQALTNAPGRLYEAIGHGQEAVRLKPSDAKAHNNLGIALAKAPGRLDEAFHQFEEALRIDPDFAEAHINLGNALLLVPGHRDKAVAQFEEALQVKPDSAEAHFDLGNALLGLPGGTAAAAAQYEKALLLKPGYAAAHFNLGGAYLRMPGHLKAAVLQFEQASALMPNSAEALATLGYALNADGQPMKAVAEYEQALRLKPELAEVHFNLAAILLGMPGRTAEARAHLEEGLRLKPDDAAARKMLAGIRPANP